MDKRFIDLVKKEQRTAVKLYLEFEKLLRELKAKRDDFLKGIVVAPPFEPPYSWDRQRIPMRISFSTSGVHVRIKSDLRLLLETTVYLKGWEICVYRKEAATRTHIRGFGH